MADTRLELQIVADAKAANSALESLISTLGKVRDAVKGGLNSGGADKSYVQATNSISRAMEAAESSTRKFGGELSKVSTTAKDAATKTNNSVAKMADGFEAATSKVRTFLSELDRVKGQTVSSGAWVGGSLPSVGKDADLQYSLGTVNSLAQGMSVAFGEAVPRVEELNAAFADPSIANYTAETQAMRAELDLANIGSVASQIKEVGVSARDASTSTKTLAQRLKELGKAFSNARGHSNGLLSSFIRIAKYRFLRAVLREIVEGVTVGVKNMYEYSKAIQSSFAPAVDAAKDALLRMKNSIGAALAPLIEMLIPYLMQAVQWFINLVNIVNQFLALLNGQTEWTRAITATSDAMDDVKSSAGGAAKAIKEVKGLLADWDELNIIQQQPGDTGSSGGGGSTKKAETDYTKMFEQVGVFDEKIRSFVTWFKDHLEAIKNLAFTIGTFIAAWKITRMFTRDLKLIAGIAMAAAGAFLFVKSTIDAITNGVTFDTLFGQLGGLALLATGLGLIFGKLGVAIALIVGGVTMFTTGLTDWIKTGEATNETLTTMSVGLLAIGGGIALLTGNWIPLVIAAVGVAATWIVGKWDWLCENVFYPIAGLFKFIWGSITNWWRTTVSPTIDNTVQWVEGKIVVPVSGFFSNMSKSIRIALAFLGQWWESFWKNTIQPIVEWIDQNIIQPIGEFFNALWGTIQGNEETNLGTWWTRLWMTTLGDVVPWIETNITDKIKGFFSGLWGTFIDSDAVQSAITWFGGLWMEGRGFAEKVGDVATNITEKIGGFFAALWGTFTNSDTVTNAVEWWNALWTEGGTFGGVVETARTIFESIGGFFTALWGTIKGDEENSIGTWWANLWSHQFLPVVETVKTNITEPISGAFTAMTESITGIWATIDSFWNETVVPGFNKIVNWIDENVIQKITGFFNGLASGIMAVFEAIVGVDYSKKTKEELMELYNQKVPEVITSTGRVGFAMEVERNMDAFKGTTGQVKEAMQKVFSEISGVPVEVLQLLDITGWNSLSEDLQKRFYSILKDRVGGDIELKLAELGIQFPVSPIVEEAADDTVSDQLDDIVDEAASGYEVEVDASALETPVVIPPAETTGFTSSVKSACEEAAGDVENMATRMTGAIVTAVNQAHLMLLEDLKLWYDQYGITSTSHNVGTHRSSITQRRIPHYTYANGGFPETGDYFLARENGPELVGTMGSRTAVANNDQIVAGIASGVAAAQQEQNTLLRQQNDYLRRILAKESTVRLEPSSKLGKINRQSEAMYAKNTGTGV